MANPGLLPIVVLASFYNNFPDLAKPKVRLGSKQRQNSLPERSGNVFLVIIPLIFLQNKGPFQSLLCFDLSPGSVKNPKEDGYEIMVSKITNPVFFPDYTIFSPSSKLKDVSQGLPRHRSKKELSSISGHVSWEKVSVLRCLFKAAGFWLSSSWKRLQKH